MTKKNSDGDASKHGGQEHPEADNEKGESDQDNETPEEPVMITSDNMIHLQNHRWLHTSFE